MLALVHTLPFPRLNPELLFCCRGWCCLQRALKLRMHPNADTKQTGTLLASLWFPAPYLVSSSRSNIDNSCCISGNDGNWIHGDCCTNLSVGINNSFVQCLHNCCTLLGSTSASCVAVSIQIRLFDPLLSLLSINRQ